MTGRPTARAATLNRAGAGHRNLTGARPLHHGGSCRRRAAAFLDVTAPRATTASALDADDANAALVRAADRAGGGTAGIGRSP